MDYKTSGVDIIKGRSFVEYIKVLAPKIDGGFSGMMDLPSGYKQPVLVSGTDVNDAINLAVHLRPNDNIGDIKEVNY